MVNQWRTQWILTNPCCHKDINKAFILLHCKSVMATDKGPFTRQNPLWNDEQETLAMTPLLLVPLNKKFPHLYFTFIQSTRRFYNHTHTLITNNKQHILFWSFSSVAKDITWHIRWANTMDTLVKCDLQLRVRVCYSVQVGVAFEVAS